MSEIASRAGCGVRTVYNVVERVVYVLPLPHETPVWFELGLFAVVKPPPDQRYPLVPRLGLLEKLVQEADMLVFCLLCHEFMSALNSLDGGWQLETMVGSELQIPSRTSDHGAVDEMQGHLVAHFVVQQDRIAVPNLDTGEELRAAFAMAFGELDSLDPKRLRRRDTPSKQWILGEAAAMELGKRRRRDGSEFPPLVGGRPMRAETAREHWLSFIPDHGA